MKKYSILLLLLFVCWEANAQSKAAKPIPAAYMLYNYLPALQNKKVGLVVNQTSTLEQTHLVDTLLKLGIAVDKIFAPEHGFRGNADAGEAVSSSTDDATGISIVSLYGDHKKPTSEDLKNLDILVFDIQDVGVRFYTYISTLHYVMEACAENKVKLLVLDRPNPNGSYVDGPVLNMKYKSFVGMHPVPIVYGMTIGEYAMMINGEKWLKDGMQCDLQVIKNESYTHESFYSLPIKPSPNLLDIDAIILYPSLCLFEGTVISVGRGTYSPFKVIGNPELSQSYGFLFNPQSIEGMSKNPPFLNETCYGIDLQNYDTGGLLASKKINLKWLMEMYQNYPKKDQFFNSFFVKLTGTDELQKQIEAGKSEACIRKSWKKDLKTFKETRSKYLLYL